MPPREIVLFPDPVLRRPAREVERFDADLERLVADLAETMYAAPGVGLAAPQVGVDLRVAVVDAGGADGGPDLHVLVNPRLVASAGRQSEEEGCLSIPGLSERVERPLRVTVEALDARGAPVSVSGEGLLARALCHELDHLDGILFFERLTGLRKELALRRLRKLPFLQEATA
ncbi:MAG: peptide deformylase [Thermoanaerobaculia bacterium]|nr:MAG: peptide deformylase [Thermoanaerobaculia bacterium]